MPPDIAIARRRVTAARAGAGPAVGARHRVPRLRARHHGRRDELGQRAAPGRGHLQRRRLRRDRLRLDGARTLLAAEIAGTQALTDKPFGVNLITMHPQLDELIRVCLEAKVGHIVLAGGIPPGGAVRAVKDGGAKLIAFTPALVLAKRLVRSGADALVIEGSEAGGHIGPVSLTVLAQEILPHIREVPVFVAGGLGRGEAILAYLEMGASGAQLGTRFAAATELIAHPSFKQAFIRAAARDALPSVQLDERFPVIPVRGLVNEGTKRFLAHPGRDAATASRPAS